jgi:hypothetical protein
MKDMIDKCSSKALICLSLITASIAIYLPWLNKPYTGDESFNLMMAYLTEKGFLPIKDFYVHVTPYYLFFYDFFMRIFGTNIITARIISFAVGAVIGLLVYFIIYNDTRKKSLAFFVWLVLQANLLFLVEGTPLSGMAHALIALLFSLAAVYLIVINVPGSKFCSLRIFLIGFCLTFSIFSRQDMVLVNGGLFIIALFPLLFSQRIKLFDKAKILTLGITGIAIASSFMIYLFVARPETFLFTYLEGTNLLGAMRQIGVDHRTIHLFSFEPLALGDFLKSYHGQTALLIFFMLSGIMLALFGKNYRCYRKTSLLGTWGVVSFVATYMLFSKHGFTWHYLGGVSPFFVIAGSPFLYWVWTGFKRKKIFSIFLLLSVISYCLYGLGYTGKRYLEDFRSFKKVGAVEEKLNFNSIKQVRLVAEEILKIFPEDGKLLSYNSAVYPEMKILPPFNFGYWEILGDYAYAAKGKEELNHHHILTEEQLLDMYNRRYFDVVLVDKAFPGAGGAGEGTDHKRRNMIERYKKTLKRNYLLYKKVGESQIYVPKGKHVDI